MMTPKDTSETKQLYQDQDTQQLLETFDPSRLCPYLNTTTSDACDAQAAFYNIIREGDELEGVYVPSRCRLSLFKGNYTFGGEEEGG